MIQQKTFVQKPHEVQRDWHLIDADEQVLGRVAVKIASILRGKHKPTYTPHVDCGDNVVIVNAERVKVSGAKEETKVYQRYSGYSGGLKEETFKHLIARRPTEVLRRAVKGMLPKGPLGRQMIRKLYIYAGPEHPHHGQLKSN